METRDRTYFHETLTAIGYHEAFLIESTSSWGLWRATHITPARVKHHEFYLYLKSTGSLQQDATRENFRKWSNLSEKSSQAGYHLILPDGHRLADNLPQRKMEFKALDAAIETDLLSSVCLGGAKRKELSGGVEDHFIDPDLILADGTTVQNATQHILEWLEKGTTGTNASIAVLVADGGIGKTTLSYMLCKQVHDKNDKTIPILIESDQWQRGARSFTTMSDVWDIATDCAFGDTIGDTINERTLATLIRKGLFRVIFDGFDELCIRPEPEFSPENIVDHLTTLTTPDIKRNPQARILLTARKTFWESIKGTIDTSKLEVFEIKGFSNDKRNKYFEKRLSNTYERTLASQLSRRIGGQFYTNISTEGQENRDKLSGVPFILDIIARSVKGCETSEPIRTQIDNLIYKEGDPFAYILEFTFQRENERQKINIDPQDQFTVFEELFFAYPNGIPFDDLCVYLDEYCKIPYGNTNVAKGFSTHPLLKRKDDHAGESYESRYEVIKVYFLARFLASRLHQESRKNEIIDLLSEHSVGKTQFLDLLSKQLQQYTEEQLVEAMNHASRMIRDHRNAAKKDDSGKALFYLIQDLLSKKEPTDKVARKQRLVQLLRTERPSQSDPKSIFRDVILTDQVAKYDLTGTKFVQCKFIDVEFKNCQFSGGSTFEKCIFDGALEFTNCSNANAIIVDDDNTLSKEAEFRLAALFQKPSKEELKKHFAHAALSQALKKLKGNRGFRPIQYRNRTGGFRSGNPYNILIWDVLERKGVIERHKISGVEKGGLNISEEETIRKDVAYYLQNGTTIGGCLDEVITILVSRRA